MIRINTENVIYSMSKYNKPVIKVPSGSVVVFETMDCFENQITNENQLISGINWDCINPATGPIFVEDAFPGDILRVEILDINLAEQGVMTSLPNEGALGSELINERTKIIPVKDGKAHFSSNITIDISPMIGVIGTAPYDDKGVPTGTPGVHGGNMDNKRICKDSVIFLPVNVTGGLLAMGDLHALMSDGEVLICGLEISGEVTVKVDVIKGVKLPVPIVYSKGKIITVASADTLDQAAFDASKNMLSLLYDNCSVEKEELAMLLSLVGELCICQIVDPLKTARMEFPLSVAEKLGCNLPK